MLGSFRNRNGFVAYSYAKSLVVIVCYAIRSHVRAGHRRKNAYYGNCVRCGFCARSMFFPAIHRERYDILIRGIDVFVFIFFHVIIVHYIIGIALLTTSINRGIPGRDGQRFVCAERQILNSSPPPMEIIILFPFNNNNDF